MRYMHGMCLQKLNLRRSLQDAILYSRRYIQLPRSNGNPSYHIYLFHNKPARNYIEQILHRQKRLLAERAALLC